jgi:hypothetical protein
MSNYSMILIQSDSKAHLRYIYGSNDKVPNFASGCLNLKESPVLSVLSDGSSHPGHGYFGKVAFPFYLAEPHRDFGECVGPQQNGDGPCDLIFSSAFSTPWPARD